MDCNGKATQALARDEISILIVAETVNLTSVEMLIFNTRSV